MAAVSSVCRPADLSSYAGPLLLGTHIWVWHLDGDTNQMTPELIALLDRCSSAG